MARRHIAALSKSLVLRSLSGVLAPVLGLVFCISGLSKILHAYEFLDSVYQYELLGPQAGLVVAMILPWLELLIGTCILLNVALRGAFLLCIALSTVFSAAQFVAIQRDLAISCGCFTGFAAQDLVGFGTLLRSASLIAGSLLCLWAIGKTGQSPLP